VVGTQHGSVHAVGFPHATSTKASDAEEIHGGANDISDKAKIMKFPAMLLSLVTLRDFSSPLMPIALCSHILLKAAKTDFFGLQARNTIFSSKDEIKHQ